MEHLIELSKLLDESQSLPFQLSPKMLNKFTKEILYSLDGLVSKSVVLELEKKESTRVKDVRRKEAKKLKRTTCQAL